jgi:hypothetical protein
MINGLYILLVWELVIGGGGRIFPIEPITLRIAIFFFSLLVWFVAIAQGRHKSGQALALSIVYAFFIAHLPALLTDAMSLQLELQQSAQIQGLLFVLSAPFIAMAISSMNVVERNARIFVFGGLLSALGFIVLTLCLYFGIINFSAFYQWSSHSQEIFFRSEGNFFAKSLFFIGIALIFTVTLRPRFWILLSALLAACILVSLTRGLVAAAFIAIIYSLIQKRSYGAVYFIAILMLCGSIFYIREIQDFFIGSEDRASSLQLRLDDFESFLSRKSVWAILMGDGFGSSLNGRQAIESTYVWALWRFGILGLLFWISPFFIANYFYRKVRRGSKNRNLATAYFSGMVFLALATATNPWINTSIGTLYSLIAIFSLRQLAFNSKEAESRIASTAI